MTRSFLMAACVAAAATACLKRETMTLKIKALALNPHEYGGQSIGLSGQVTDAGPGNAYFILEDESGRLFVSTESSAERLNCPKGSQATLEGRLKQDNERLYFLMDRMLECKSDSKL